MKKARATAGQSGIGFQSGGATNSHEGRPIRYDACMETRSFVVDGTMARQVRDLLASRGRLTFSERRDWPWFYMRRFTVTGPQWALDTAIAAAMRLVEQEQAEMRTW